MFPIGAADIFPCVRALIMAMPLWAIAALLFVFFSAASLGARHVVRRRSDAQACEEASEQAKSLLTGMTATFAFFVGFAINVTWGAVTAAQVAVEQQAAALHQMAWEISNITDRAESAALMDKLKIYAVAAAHDDGDHLAKGDAANLPSAGPFDGFEKALHAYVSGPKAQAWQVSALVSGASGLTSTSAGVAAVANRFVPRPLAILVMIVGVLASIVMGLTTVVDRRATLIYVWCVIPALSLTVVLALAYPFALRSGANLAPLRVVAEQIAAQ